MTPQESREQFLDSVLSEKDLMLLKEQGTYLKYVEGKVSFQEVIKQVKDQAP